MGAPASRARVLIVPTAIDRVVETDLGQYFFEVGNLLRAGERFATATTGRGYALAIGLLVIGDSKVSRTLEDVEQLPEGQVHQPEDHGQRVDRVQRRIEAALKPHARHREEQPAHGHGEQTSEREEITGPFRRQRARIAEPTSQEDEHSREHQDCSDIEGMEDEPADNTLSVEANRADPRHVHLVTVGLLFDALEVQQTKRKWDGHEPGKDAPPENKLMSEPSRSRSATNEPLCQQLSCDQRWQRHNVVGLALPECLPAAAVEHRRRWPSQPDGVAVGHAEHSEDDAEEIPDQRRVEPDQTIASNERHRDNDCNAGNTPRDPSSIQMVRRASHVEGYHSIILLEAHREFTDTEHPIPARLANEADSSFQITHGDVHGFGRHRLGPNVIFSVGPHSSGPSEGTVCCLAIDTGTMALAMSSWRDGTNSSGLTGQQLASTNVAEQHLRDSR